MFIIVPEQRFARISFSNSGSRENFFENVFFEPVWRRKLFQMKVWVAAINSIKFSSKSELTSRFFSRLKFRFFFETSNGRLPLEISSDRPQTWPKRVSDDPRRFIFRRQTKIFRRNVRVDVCCVYTRYTCVLCTALHRVRPLPHCVGSWGGTGDPTLFHLGGGIQFSKGYVNGLLN